MEIDEVFDELHDAANHLGVVAPDFGTSKGKAYEVWIMLEIVVRLLRRGVDVYPHDRNDAIEPYFRVSGAPADMPAKSPAGGGLATSSWSRSIASSSCILVSTPKG